MKKIIRIAITATLSLFIGIASLAAAENTPSEKMTVYSLPEVVCTAERTPSVTDIAVALPDMSHIEIVMVATDDMLAALDEEVYELPEIVCTAERTPSVNDISVTLADMSNIGIVMATTDDILAALDEEVNMFPENHSRYSADAAPVPPRRPERAFAMMRPPMEKRMAPPKSTMMSFSL